MISIDEINNTIEELQQHTPSLAICSNLASLYTLRHYLTLDDKTPLKNEVTKEYNDILPDYQYYCDVKRRYQLGEVTQDKVLDCMREVCREIREFISTLYSSTDTQEERDLLKSMLHNIEV